jgi:hypothetical protein
VGTGAAKVCATVATGGQDGFVGTETVERAILQVEGSHTDTFTCFVHHAILAIEKTEDKDALSNQTYRSMAKNSMKKLVLWRRDWPYRV